MTSLLLTILSLIGIFIVIALDLHNRRPCPRRPYKPWEYDDYPPFD